MNSRTVYIAALLCLGALTLPVSAKPEAAEGEVSPELRLLWQRGESAFERGAAGEALEIFNEALTLDTERARSWNYLGGVHFSRGEYFKALLHFKQALELDPGDVRAVNNIATTYERIGEYTKAEAFYLRSIESEPAYPVSYRNLGIIYAEHLERPESARKYWEQFLRLSPEGPAADDIRRELQTLPAGELPD